MNGLIGPASARAGRCADEEDLASVPRSLPVTGRDGVADLHRARGVGEDEHRAAEPAAEEARTERAGVDRELDEEIELRNRDLVVVAEARMAFAEEPTGRDQLSSLERHCEPAYSLVLGDDVPQPAR